MLLIKGYTLKVNTLKDDSFEVLKSLHSYMKSKLHEKNHVIYRNYSGNNQEYWGKKYIFLSKLINLPENQRKDIVYILSKEIDGQVGIFYAYGKLGYGLKLTRKTKEVHKIMDRINEIFEIENEEKPLIKKWKYLTYIMS